jgi:hypothetical protein
VRLAEPEPLDSSGRSTVARIRILDGPAGAPASVISKSAAGTEEHPYDPADGRRFGPAWRFFNDWAGAEFLTRASPERPLAPRFLGGDRDLGFILLEDLGAGESAADLLLGSDPGRAREALLGLAETLGRMHAVTAGRTGEYLALRASLGPDPQAPVPDMLALLEKMAGPCRQLGLTLSPEVVREVTLAARRISVDPGPFAAYSHGDACPDNNRILQNEKLQNEVRLIDFEFGTVRHALADGVYGRVPFPTCWCVNRLPPEITRGMELVYRTELIRGIPEAADDRLFDEAVVAACARWLVWTSGDPLAESLVKDDQWGIAGMRQRLVYRLALFAETVEEKGGCPALGELAGRLAASLRQRWGEESEMPLYPAFRAG